MLQLVIQINSKWKATSHSAKAIQGNTILQRVWKGVKGIYVYVNIFYTYSCMYSKYKWKSRHYEAMKSLETQRIVSTHVHFDRPTPSLDVRLAGFQTNWMFIRDYYTVYVCKYSCECVFFFFNIYKHIFKHWFAKLHIFPQQQTHRLSFNRISITLNFSAINSNSSGRNENKSMYVCTCYKPLYSASSRCVEEEKNPTKGKYLQIRVRSTAKKKIK